MNFLVILQVNRNFFSICPKKKEVPESISGRCSVSILLYSDIKREIGLKLKKDAKIR